MKLPLCVPRRDTYQILLTNLHNHITKIESAAQPVFWQVVWSYSCQAIQCTAELHGGTSTLGSHLKHCKTFIVLLVYVAFVILSVIFVLNTAVLVVLNSISLK